MKKKRTRLILSVGIAALLSVAAIYCRFENANIETTQISVADSDIPVGFDGYKIIHISDLHNTEFGKNNCILLGKMREHKPDAIFITGDIIDSRRTNIEIAADFIEQAVELAPIYYVAGNHESRVNEYSELSNRMKALGVNILDNEFVELKKDGSKINLAGLTDPSFADDYGADTVLVFDKYLSEMNFDSNNYTVVLSHRPEAFDFYAESRVDLVFSGHAHGGQFRLPFIGGVVAPNQGLFPKYTSGVYENGNTKMIVSRGLGNSIIPLRINNNPQIIVVTLKCE